MRRLLQNKAAMSVFWSAAERFSVQAVQFVLNILLARLIVPEEFGLIAMINVFIQIAQAFVDSGFSNALIQKKNKNEIDFYTVFLFNFSISLSLYIIFYIFSPIISDFYGEPRLTSLCRWLGVSIIIQGLSVVPIAKLTISLDFKTQAKSSFVSILVSGCIGLFFAYNGFGAKALVIQFVLNSFLNTVFLYCYTRWRPHLIFSVNSFTGLFSFGSKLLVAGLMQTIYVNLYSLVIAKKYSAINAGYYNQSNIMSRFPSVSLMAVITRAIYPIQCEIQDDEEKLLLSYYKNIGISCFLVFPIMCCLSALSESIIDVILTRDWLPMSSIFSLICLGYMWNAPIAQNNQIVNVRGRSDLFLKAEIIKKIVGLIILFSTLPFGIIVVCIGIIAYNLFDMFIMSLYAHEVIRFSYKKYLFIVLTYAFIAIVLGLLVMTLVSFISFSIWKLVLGLVFYWVLYIVFCYCCNMPELLYLKEMITSFSSHFK